MKGTILMLLFGLALVACNTTPKEQDNSTKQSETVGDPLDPNQYMFTDLSGVGINIEDFAGKKVFVNFWATWCKPCVAEMPDLKKLSETLGDDYVFLFASDEPISKISTFAEQQQIDLTFVHLNKDLQLDLKIQALPTSFIYDTQGIKRKRITGAMDNWNSPDMIENLRSIE